METLPAVLYALFTLLSAVGAYWIGAHFSSRRVGWIAAAAVVLFFVALAAYVAFLPRWLGAAPT